MNDVPTVCLARAGGNVGLDRPRPYGPVKPQKAPADVTVYRTRPGTKQTFNAEQGLLMWLGGFNKVVEEEARQRHFTVRLWDSNHLVDAIYRDYERLPTEMQAELPLKQVWMVVPEDSDE